MDDQLLNSIKILALKAVESPSYDDVIRYIGRWYSETYNTPLPTVQNLSDEELLQTWFEVKYRHLRESDDDKDREEYAEIKHAILYGEELESIEQEDDDWAREMIETIKREQAALTKKLEKLPKVDIKVPPIKGQIPPSAAELPNLDNDIPSHMEISGADFENSTGDGFV